MRRGDHVVVGHYSRSCWLVVALLLAAACGGGSVDRPEHTGETAAEGTMQLTSSAFENEEDIPARFTCDGEDLSPPLALEGIPSDAASLVLVMDDPDAPGGTWDHWVAFDIPVTRAIPEAVGALGTGGENSWGRTDYGGPCPPSGRHRYFFTVYALDTTLDLTEGSDKAAVLEAMEGNVLAQATLMGRYSR